MKNTFKPIKKKNKSFAITPQVWCELSQFAKAKGWILAPTIEKIIINYLEEQRKEEKNDF